jgi:hypothetical protein
MNKIINSIKIISDTASSLDFDIPPPKGTLNTIKPNTIIKTIIKKRNMYIIAGFFTLFNTFALVTFVFVIFVFIY